jgi:hypothetical protein
MSKDPAFLFYPNDYIGGTMGMTFEEKGAYMELLMLQFNRGHMNIHMIERTVGENWKNIKDKFKQDENGLFYNERLEQEKEKRANFTESRRNNRSGINQKTLESDNNQTCVYLFKDLDSGYIKIGASVNPKNRLSTIKSRENKRLLFICYFENCTLADEKNIHKNFGHYHINGDWFNINEQEVIDYITNHMNNVNINVNTKDLFINNIKEYQEILGDSFTEFVDYWCEPNKNGKLRYELEKFFDVKRRINTWTKNKLRYGNSKTLNPTATSRERMDALAKWVHS